jgi:hypothetical protein
VIPDETTNPIAAIMAKRSTKSFDYLQWRQLLVMPTSPEHALIDMMFVTLDAIDGEEEERNHHHETEHDPDVLYHSRQIRTRAGA